MSVSTGPYFARLMVARPVAALLRRADDVFFAAFKEAKAYAETLLAQYVQDFVAPDSFLVPYGDIVLFIQFSRRTERFYIAGIAFDRDPPPPGASAPSPLQPPLVERVLHALGLPVEPGENGMHVDPHAPLWTDNNVEGLGDNAGGVALTVHGSHNDFTGHANSASMDVTHQPCEPSSSSRAVLQWKRDLHFRVLEATPLRMRDSLRMLTGAVEEIGDHRIMLKFFNRIGFVAFVTLACPALKPSS